MGCQKVPKFAFQSLISMSKYVRIFLKKNSFSILDSQFYNEHLTQFGAFEIKNKIYLEKLKVSIDKNRTFTFIESFQEVLSLLQPSNHKS